MTATPQQVLCPINQRPSNLYCTRGHATYYIEPTSAIIFQHDLPPILEMMEYANTEYSAGAYKNYASARELKIATALPRLEAIKKVALGNRLLDVGCATGFFLEAAAEQGFDVTGVEFSTVAISLARPDIRERIVCGDVNALSNQESAKFDVVSALDIVEHVQDPGKFLSEIREILRPGGILALSTPDTGHYLRYVMASRWPMLQPMQHTFLFSRRGLKALLESCGYVEVMVETAHKVLTVSYLAEQLAATNPTMHSAYRAVWRFIPPLLRDRPFAVNIGEMFVCARKPLTATGDGATLRSRNGGNAPG
jgi:2-polyprenyl-3-methyl-5-hydroxy-6-metoxy-1,4-benzoquinol methylase